jgi:hypothetical protein
LPVKSSDIHPGLVLRVISSHGLGAPVGSLATVESVETSRSGDWVCHVRYLDKRPVNHRTRLYRSHLWLSDLGRFEIVKPDAASKPKMRKTPAATPIRVQLRLPFDQDGIWIKTGGVK